MQDAFLGLTRARQAGTMIVDPKAYLTTAVTRLGFNYLRSARVRREDIRRGLATRTGRRARRRAWAS